MSKPKQIRPRITKKEFAFIKEIRKGNLAAPEKDDNEIRRKETVFFIIDFSPIDIYTRFLKIKIGFHLSIKRNKVKERGDVI